MRPHRTPLLVVLALALLACDKSTPTPDRSVVAEELTALISVLGATVEEGPLPEPTDTRVTLLPLEPTVLGAPGGASLMALEVDDPDEREVEATLIQFEDENTHQSVPNDDPGSLVDNELDLAEDLCDARCNVVFVVLVREAVVLAGGAISRSTTRQLVVDCRALGSADACEPGQSDDEVGRELLCGDVTDGQTLVSGDSVIDAHFDAVRQLADAVARREQGVTMAVGSIADALGLAGDTQADAVASMLSARIGEQTEAGLMLQLGDRGCGVKRVRVAHALRACDPTGGGELGSLQCDGVCEPDDPASCGSAPSSGCRGLLDAEDCDGSCVGACELVLDSPTSCEGTCSGSCDGTCPDDGDGNCLGPCSGLCQGSCRTLSSASCAGSCTGLCDAADEGEPLCGTPLVAYCAADVDPIGCQGDCFGQVSLASGSAPCRTSASAVGRVAPRCEPPLVQLSFAFASGLAADDQTALGELVDELNADIATLVTEGTRLDMLATAADDLLAAAQGAVGDRVATELAGDPDSQGLVCADQRLPEITGFLTDRITQLAGLQQDVADIVGVLTTTP